MNVLKSCSILVLLAASVASAQIGGGVGAHTGISFSSFDKAIKDYYGMGFGFGAHGDLNVGKYFTGRLNFDYHMFGADSKKLIDQIAREQGVAASDLTVSGMTANILGITLSGIGKLPTGSAVTPYALAGLGMNFYSRSDLKVTYQGQDESARFPKFESKSKFGINFGAGAEFSLSKTFSLGADFRYVLIFSSDAAKEEENNAHLPFTIYGTYIFN